MKFNLSLDDLSLIYPEQVFLEFSPEKREQLWQQTQRQNYSNTAARWNAYLNCLCLNTFLTYLETEPDVPGIPKVWHQLADLPSVWEVVNGTAVELDKVRLVLIPSEASTFTELRVPREWVELPEWVGNYYLAVQLNLEECWLQVWGYATHQQLQEKGRYDRMDETYSVDAEELIEDLTVMWVVEELYLSSKHQVQPLPRLSSLEAEALLEQLSQKTPYSPRLDVPFVKWGALVADDQWRQELYQRRLKQLVSIVEPREVTINLGEWFEDIFKTGWQSLDRLLTTDSENLALSFRGDRSTLREVRNVAVEGIKLIDLGMELGNQSVALLVGLVPEAEQRVGIRVQLYPAGGKDYLPPDIKLALLSQSGTNLLEVQARIQDILIQLKRFTCPIGKGFSIQVALNHFSITEEFVIELLPGTVS
ncbi:MAG: DUF1822 family protein [Symploca sp. SIO1A3]|nr:DUF1822 family protein [Symploca sp. SIO2C1]NER53159.1 DUF1822 family protein [Symploca sp. SIO1A3]